MAIVLLFGIPGSGKSTLARRLCDEFGHGGELLSFDSVAKDIVWDEKSFRSLRQESLSTINQRARDLAAQCNRTLLAAPGVLVVDDIMYLCSMRREVYVIARNSGLPIIVVWVNTELEEALRRNGQRDGAARIDDGTVRKIHEQLEPPNVKHICDRHSITIDGSSDQSISDGVSDVLARVHQLWSRSQEERQVRRAMHESAPAGLQSGNTSLLKDLDAALRNIVAFAMKAPEVRINKGLSKAVGNSFAAAKARTLQVAHRSAASTHHFQNVEERAVWLRAHCEDFVTRAEDGLCAGSGVDAGHIHSESSAGVVFDAARLYIAEKFDSP